MFDETILTGNFKFSFVTLRKDSIIGYNIQQRKTYLMIRSFSCTE